MNCTNPTQSEMLIKKGVDINTADMYYRDGKYFVGRANPSTMSIITPIWSLEALMDLMPSEIERYGKTYIHVLRKWYDTECDIDRYEFSYEEILSDEPLQGSVHDSGSIIIAAFNLVEWLYSEIL